MRQSRIISIIIVFLALVFPVALEVFDASMTGDEVVTYSMANNSDGGFVFSEGRVAAYFREYIVSDSVSGFLSNLKREASDVLQNRRSARFFQYETDPEVKYYTQDEMADWFEKREYERFNLYDTWLFAQSDDANSYLYYSLLNICCSLFPSFSAAKWSGFLLNYVLYLILLLLFYRLARHLDAEPVPAAVFTLLMACSYEVLNKVIYIRTYILAMCFVVLLTDLHVRYWKQYRNTDTSDKIHIWIFIPIVILAYISHYTTAFYTASLAAATVIALLRARQKKQTVHYILIMILSGILALLADPVSVPGMLSKLLGGSGGGGASAFLREAGNYFLMSLIPGIPMAVWLIAVLIVSYVRYPRNGKFSAEYKILLGAVGIFLVIILAGTKGARYLSAATPVLLLLMELYFYKRISGFNNTSGAMWIAAVTAGIYLISSGICTFANQDRLNRDALKKEEVISGVSGHTCIFLRNRRSGYENAWYLPQFSSAQVITLSTENWEEMVDRRAVENDEIIVIADPSAKEMIPAEWFETNSFKQTECLLSDESADIYVYRKS